MASIAGDAVVIHDTTTSKLLEMLADDFFEPVEYSTTGRIEARMAAREWCEQITSEY